MVKTALTLLALTLSSPAFSQVDEIRNASASASKTTESRSSGDVGSSKNCFLCNVVLFLPHWQQYKLIEDNKARYPSMVSLEAFGQGGYKSEGTYFGWPRIRGNWGLFSTDFRVNYIFEKDDAGGGIKRVQTNDWQVLQLNITTSRLFTFRVGAGVMTEIFDNFNQYSEVTVGFGIHAPDQTSMFYAEYRDAFKSGLDVKARIELSAQYMHQVFHSGALKGYLTGGVVYQKYYGQIDFWAIQAGLALRVFKDRERF